MIGIVGKKWKWKNYTSKHSLGFHKINEEIYNDMKVDDIRNWLSNVGYVAQNTYLLDASIKENIAFGIKNEINLNKIKEVISSAQLTEMTRDLKMALIQLLEKMELDFPEDKNKE